MCPLLFRLASSLLLCGTLAATAQIRQGVDLAPQPSSTPQSVEGGMWRLDAGFEATLRLKNVLVNQILSVTPSLIMADGTRAPLAPVTLAPAGVATLNIGDAVNHLTGAAAAHRSAYGMVSIDYTWSWPGALMASLQNIDETAMLSFQSAPQSVRTGGSPRGPAKLQRIESGWWKPYASTSLFAFLGNGTDTSEDVALDLRSATGVSLLHRQFHLAPHASTRFDLLGLLEVAPTTGAAGSLTLTYSGPEGGLIAEAGLEDLTNGFSHTLHLTEAHPERDHDAAPHTVTVATPGVMFGAPLARMQFPQNTSFRPFLLLHNEAAAARNITVHATWTENGAVAQRSLGILAVPSRATELFDFAPLLTGTVKPDNGSIQLSESFSGKENDIHFEAGSTDQSGNYVFDAQSRIEDWTAARTICYWTVNGDTNTMVSLWNYSPDAQDLVLTLHFRGGTYDLPIRLNPDADLELDLATLIKQQKPDAHGNVIPSNILEGSATLSSSQGERERVNIAASTSTFNVRNATCTPTCETCNGITSTEFNPGYFGVSIGGPPTYPQAIITYTSGNKYTITPNNYWSANTSVAIISQYGGVTGVGDGTTTTGFDYYNQPAGVYICSMTSLTCPYQNFNGSSTTYVTVPGVLSCSPAMRGTPTTCSVTGASKSVKFIGWSFAPVASQPSTVISANTTSSWTGIAVTSGVVFVTDQGADNVQHVLSAPLIVTPRNWHTNPSNAEKVANGASTDLATLKSPPQAGQNMDAGVGQYVQRVSFSRATTFTISSGPNSGYTAYTTADPTTPLTSTKFQFEIVPDLEDTSSAFYMHQTGTWSTLNPNGIIAGNALYAQTLRHESAPVFPSHYSQWQRAITGNNIGDYYESRIAPPYTNIDSFNQETAAKVSSLQDAINSAAIYEPPSVNQDNAGQIDGYICYSPYTSCQ